MHPNETGGIGPDDNGDMRDAVTGLPRDHSLVDRLSRSIHRAGHYPGFHFAVLAVELDGQTADVPGALLEAAAHRLQANLRLSELPPTLRHDDILARLDGARFGILLDGLKDVAHAMVVAERVLAALLEPFVVDGREIRLRASVGVSLSATGYQRAEDALRDADVALERARSAGGGRCEVFDTKALELAQSALRLEADFAGAPERGEFFLVYQPIVSLSTGYVVGFEALVRWQHPVLGLIGPPEFIPLAERTGFIVPLGRWVIAEACRQLTLWQAQSPDADVWVSVNLSSVQFNSPALVEEIAEMLRVSGVEPRRLVLELTESAAMENPMAVRASLLQLRAIGVRVSLDDFGTGHSSLAYLRQFPLDSLKVDRSFVRGIETSADMVSIVNAVKAMAHQLGLRVVAEGIEKDEQVGLLRAIDCEMGQGFLFSRPLAAASAGALLSSGRPLRKPGAVAVLPALPARAIAPAPTSRAVIARRSLYAAAGLAVAFLSAGLPRLVREPVTVAPPATTPASGVAARTEDVPLAPAPADAVVASPLVEAPTAPRPAAPPRRATAGSADTKRASAAFASPSATAASAPAVAESRIITSLRVVHQHRLGNCRGLLVVSRDGVDYQPDDAEHQERDGFTFPFTRFLSVLTRDSLVIRSDNRDYRFRAEIEDNGGVHLERIDAAIARQR